MLTWHIVTRAAYDAASEASKSDEKLFFLSDTHEIYRGTQSFSESVILYTTEPSVKAVGKLYVNSTTLEGKIWNGSAWTTVIQPVQAAIVAGDATKPVSSKAVEDYVGAEIAKVTGSGDLVADVAYDSAKRELTVTMANDTTEKIALNGLAVSLDYNAETGALNLKDAAGTTIGTGINLDLERFVSAASYDHSTGKISLTFNDNETPLEIDIGDLVDTYTAKSGKGVSLTVTGNEFTAEAIVATTAGNMLKLTDSGLFVAATDISGKMDKDTDAVSGNLAKYTTGGNVVDAGAKIGGATLAATPNATTLATEAAVNAIKTALTTEINKKMNKVATGKADEILVADANGDAALSGIKVGGATVASAPDAATVATEAAVVDYVQDYSVAKTSIVKQGAVASTVAAASDAKVASEKAMVDALTWKTTV